MGARGQGTNSSTERPALPEGLLRLIVSRLISSFAVGERRLYRSRPGTILYWAWSARSALSIRQRWGPVRGAAGLVQAYGILGMQRATDSQGPKGVHHALRGAHIPHMVSEFGGSKRDCSHLTHPQQSPRGQQLPHHNDQDRSIGTGTCEPSVTSGADNGDGVKA